MFAPSKAGASSSTPKICLSLAFSQKPLHALDDDGFEVRILECLRSVSQGVIQHFALAVHSQIHHRLRLFLPERDVPSDALCPAIIVSAVIIEQG